MHDVRYATRYAMRAATPGAAWRWVGLLLLLGLAAPAAHGNTIIPPRHLGELARMSDAVVLARAGVSATVAQGGMIYTHTSFDVLDVVSGTPGRGTILTVETYGGVLDGQGWAFGGTPQFAEATVYMLFLNRQGAVWHPRMAAYGLLERVLAPNGEPVLQHVREHHNLVLLPRPDGVVPEPVGTYDEAALLQHLRQVTTNRAAWNHALVDVPETLRPLGHHDAAKNQDAPTPCVYMTYDGHPIRWNTFEDQQPVNVFAEENGDDDIDDGDDFLAVQDGIATWVSIPGVDIGYHWGGTAAYTPDCTDGSASPLDIAADQGLVQYNDPCDQLPDLLGCTGVLAQGGSLFTAGASGRHEHRDLEWNTSLVGYVIVNNGVGACLTPVQYHLMMAHELGHSLGFGHIPFGTGASVMNPTCCVDRSEIDELCAFYAYSDDPLPGAPGEITLLSPQDGAADLPTNVAFAWAPDATSDAYHLQVTTDAAFSDIAYEAEDLTQSTHNGGSFDDGTSFFWRVRGRNGIGAGPWSAVYGFTTQVASAPPDSVVLTTPADTTINQSTTPRLAWEPAARATRYHLQVATDPALSDRVYENDRLQRITQPIGPLAPLTDYYWRVRASNSAGASPWSAVWRFKTLPPLPGPVLPVAPAYGAVDVPPHVTLAWEPAAFAETYHLQVGTTFTFSQMVLETDTVTTPSFVVELPPLKDKYFWRVRSVNAAGAGPWMDLQLFTTGPPPEAVALVAPDHDATGQPSTIPFAWRTVTGADVYHLQVSTDSSFAGLVYEADSLRETTIDVGPLAYLTTHYWRVRGRGKTGAGDWSATRRFTVAVGTAAERLDATVPDRFVLHPNYPNPFNTQTTLRFDVPETAFVSLVVYDVLGRVVDTPVAKEMPPGRYRLSWDAAGRPSGVYLVRLRSGFIRQTQRLLLVR